MRTTTILVLAASLSLGACRAATPPSGDDAVTEPTELAAEPSPLSSALDVKRSPPTGERDDETSPGGNASPEATRPAAPFTTIGSVEDSNGDAGPQTPGYADLLTVTIADDGHSARITVRMEAAIPDPAPPGEQIAVGVDLYKRDTTESDYQVYAHGTSDGWLAYLSTPSGLVEYEGRFAMGGARMVFTVPWSSLGGIRGTRFSAYTDWDREQPVLNQVGSDRAPGRGKATFSR